MATLRWMEAPESDVKTVEAMYENTKARVGPGMTNEHWFETRQCSKSIAFHLSNGTNQQEDQHNRCHEEDYVCRRSCDRCKTPGRIIARCTGKE